MIYLDNAATTRPLPQVLDTVNRCFENFGNPSSTYLPGVRARQMINEARAQLAKAFSVPEAGIIFCGSGTESDNLALKGTLEGRKSAQTALITTRLEHSAVTKTAEWLQQQGHSVDFVRTVPETGQVDLNHLEELVRPETSLVSIHHVNSETGIIQDLAAVSKIVKAKNPETVIHSDGVQAFSKFPIDLKGLGVDLYSISGHKFHGVKGAGALIMAGPIPIKPVIHGGGQEFGLRSGTENVAAVAGMGAAVDSALSELKERYDRVTDFSQRFVESLKKKFPQMRTVDIPGKVPHIVNLSFPGILGEVLLNHLAQQEIYVATGSACNAGAKHLSPVLKEMGFADQRIRESIRISIAAAEIPGDFEGFLSRFVNVVDDLLDII